MRYIAFLGPAELGAVYGVVAGYGTVDSILDVPHALNIADVRSLLAALTVPSDDCLVIDPSLATPAVIEVIAYKLSQFSRSVVVFCNITTAALVGATVLARRAQTRSQTCFPIRFVFRGVANERSALQQALLLTPDVELGAAFLSAIELELSRLPAELRRKVRDMFLAGERASSLEAMANSVVTMVASTQRPTFSSGRLTRRTLDRHLAAAGFVSGKGLLDATRVISGYDAVAISSMPLKSVARMLGYRGVRTMNARFASLLGVSCEELRRNPLSHDEVVERLARKLTKRGG